MCLRSHADVRHEQPSPAAGFAQHRGASCPTSLNTVCEGALTTSSAYLSANSNPNTLYGALVSGPSTATDSYIDSRQNVDNTVSVEFNSAFQGALAILAGSSWDVCTERNGILDQEGVHAGNGM